LEERVRLRAAIAAERAELATFLRTLSDEDWLLPSLCDGWRVRDVVAHLLIDTIPLGQYVAVAARQRTPHRINQFFVDAHRDLPTSELVRRLESTVGHGAFATLMPRVALADLVVHHQDIRRPLARPRAIEPARLLHALRHPDPFARPRRNTAGLRFIASDIDWAAGSGREVRGTGEALALAIVGRPAVLSELEGDGVSLLARRIQRDTDG
jgi:uncharacterized protein (TIGR03083 family)